jgi:hypothetical protein
MTKIKYIIILLLFTLNSIFGQSEEGNIDNLPVHEYTITLKEELVSKAGKQVKGMTVNGTIPGPTLEFTEGEYAVIYVKNEMSVETSVHWHGLLLPNFYDGVPYLNTPPIEAGQTQKYEFPIKQSGTYWYHSHTMLQEQSGVYGSIVIKPKTKILNYDKDLVLVLSDWTNEKPMNVLRNLKRGNEWYNIKKGTATPLNQVIARGGFSAQLNFWRQRMESADIADVYYPAFLINGKQSIEYPEFKPGEKVRLRIIDGSASTSFWMTFGGETPLLVAADGNDVVPVKKNKTFIAVAETYDFIVIIPESGKIEYKITAQDGSGTATAYLGKGTVLPAMEIPKPDKIGMMKKMSKMKMKMGAHALKFEPNKDERFEMKDEYGMHMEGMSGMKMDNMKSKDSMKMDKMDGMKMENGDKMQGMDMYAEYNYDYLKSSNKTNYDKNVPVKEVLLNLTGNMNRYIWSLNGVPLSEADKIKISSKEVTRITFNNLTMMHHPMHLHGHFFRVINENGDYSPLKHTVNVPPMQKVVIEFYGNNGDEYGDWFFHCHILYHMMGGMARIVSYDTPRNPKMKEFPEQKLINETNKWYSWGMINAASHTTGFNLMTSNLRNQFNASLEYGWNKNLETEVTYERYLHDYLRVFGGVNIENENEKCLDQFKTTAVAGIRFLTPYLFSLDARIDNELRPRFSLGRSIMIFPKLSIFGYYEYQLDLGIVNNLPSNRNYSSETVWSAGASYILSRNFSAFSSYDNRFGVGVGLMTRF